jgi:glycosyltransferase involved in cell wall biosynthesis
MVVLIPAHSEEASIAAMLNALLGQSRVPDRIVVIADNCTDRTEQIARRFRRSVGDVAETPQVPQHGGVDHPGDEALGERPRQVHQILRGRLAEQHVVQVQQAG